MPARKPAAARRPKRGHVPEEAAMLKSLLEHGKVVEAETENVSLPPGATHVLVKSKGARPRLVEKRKSLF